MQTQLDRALPPVSDSTLGTGSVNGYKRILASTRLFSLAPGTRRRGSTDSNEASPLSPRSSVSVTQATAAATNEDSARPRSSSLISALRKYFKSSTLLTHDSAQTKATLANYSPFIQDLDIVVDAPMASASWTHDEKAPNFMPTLYRTVYDPLPEDATDPEELCVSGTVNLRIVSEPVRLRSLCVSFVGIRNDHTVFSTQNVQLNNAPNPSGRGERQTEHDILRPRLYTFAFKVPINETLPPSGRGSVGTRYYLRFSMTKGSRKLVLNHEVLVGFRVVDPNTYKIKLLQPPAPGLKDLMAFKQTRS